MKKLNDKQKENLATFYNNLALVLLMAGAITPIFTGIESFMIFSVRLILSLTFGMIVLQFSQSFLK